MKRTISKRLELNELEAKVLRMKSDQCGLGESDYIRELIMGSQPVEAPPRQFYEQMGKMNQMVSMIPQMIASADSSVSGEAIEDLRGMYKQLIDVMVDIKEIVSKARFFSIKCHETWEYEVEQANKEGKTPPTLEEVEERYTKNVIRHPAIDYDLGWNALGIRPPFLANDGSQSVDSFASSNILEEGDY